MADLFLALLAGHLLADFALQPKWILQRKHTLPGLGAHTAIVAAVHAALLVPFDDVRLFIVAGVVAVTHAVIDAAKVRWQVRHGATEVAFLVDQALHVLIIALAVAAFPGAAWQAVLPPEAFAVVGLLAATVTAGFALTESVLRRLPPLEGSTGLDQAGTIIGIVERILVFAFVAAGQFAAVAFVLAAKSVARFQDLDDRAFAEYYLVGTLTSFLVAALLGLLASHILPL